MIRIVTDSSCDLPDDVVAAHDIDVVPLTIRFGESEYVDRHDIDTDGFWTRLERSDELPETAAPSAGAFMDTFDRADADGADGVLAICLSSELSATYQAAVIGAERFTERSGLPVRVLDSRAVSMGLGLQVIAAAEDAAAGTTLDEMVVRAMGRPALTTVVAALDTVEFLKRGGRVGGAAALVAGLFDVKPLITLEDGVIAPAGRVRTRSKATEHIVQACLDRVGTGRLSIFGGRAPQVDEVVRRVEAAGADVVQAELGAVVGTHAGPGAIGFAHLTG